MPEDGGEPSWPIIRRRCGDLVLQIPTITGKSATAMASPGVTHQ